LFDSEVIYAVQLEIVRVDTRRRDATGKNWQRFRSVAAAAVAGKEGCTYVLRVRG